MIFDNDGEEGFVGQMVDESQHFQTRRKYVINQFYFIFINNNSYVTPRC